MLQDFLTSNEVQTLDSNQQSQLIGGVDRCCIRVPSGGFTLEISDGDGWCNDNYECKVAGSTCACF